VETFATAFPREPCACWQAAAAAAAAAALLLLFLLHQWLVLARLRAQIAWCRVTAVHFAKFCL
jgi:hypothetical protein